jgi:hypothetical protein
MFESMIRFWGFVFLKLATIICVFLVALSFAGCTARLSHFAGGSPSDSVTKANVDASKLNLKFACLMDKKLSRDWAEFPAVFKFRTHAPLFVISDVHGNFDAFFELLKRAGIIRQKDESAKVKPSNFEWIAEDAFLVVVGDLINKGTQSIRTLKFAQNLQMEASKKGGKAIFLSGNHEIGFIGNPFDTKYEIFRGEVTAEDSELCDPRDSVGKLSFAQWMFNLPAAVIVNGVYISHSGYVDGSTIEQIGQNVQLHLTAWDWDSPFFCGSSASGLSQGGFFNANGWWATALETEKKRMPALFSEVLDKNLSALGAVQIIFGHDPNPFDSKLPVEGVFRNEDGRGVFKIDGGAGNGSGELALLRCLNWRLENETPNGCLSPDYLLLKTNSANQTTYSKFKPVPWSQRVPKPKTKERSGC